MSCVADSPSRKEAVEPSAATKVEHRFAKLQRRNGLRIAAPKPQVRTLRNSRHIFA